MRLSQAREALNQRSSRVVLAILAGGVATSVYVSSGEASSQSPQPNRAITVSGLVKKLIDINPKGPGWGEDAPGKPTVDGMGVLTFMPSGEAIQLRASTIETKNEMSKTYKGPNVQVNPQNVDELDVVVYASGTPVTDKPEYGYTFIKESNNKWQATYYQQYDNQLPYSVGESGQNTVLTSTGPGNTVNRSVNPHEAHSIYNQIAGKTNAIIDESALLQSLDLHGRFVLPNPTIKQ
jgi:hypothetical protein